MHLSLKFIIIIISVFCSRAGSSLQAPEPRLQCCRRQVFHCKLSNQGCSFTRAWTGVVASHCFPHPTLSLESEQTLKDLKRYHGHHHGGEESGFSRPSGLYWNSPQGLNISSIRVLGQIRDPEILNTFCPLKIHIWTKFNSLVSTLQNITVPLLPS